MMAATHPETSSVAEPVLAVRGVCHRYGDVPVLDDVDARFRPGRIHALLGENGILVPSQDPSALASAIALLFRDRSLAEKLASAGHEWVHAKFCVDDMLRDIEAIYLLAVGGTAGEVSDRHGVRGAHQ